MIDDNLKFWPFYNISYWIVIVLKTDLQDNGLQKKNLQIFHLKATQKVRGYQKVENSIFEYQV